MALPETQQLGKALRRALQHARFTAQTHLKAIEEAELALETYDTAMALQADDVEREREDLARQRDEFEEERNNFDGQLGQQAGEAGALDDGYAQFEPEPEGQEIQLPEQQYVKEEVDPSIVPSRADHGVTKALHRRRGRTRSRSRSRRRGAVGGRDSMDALRRKAASLGLDANASRQIQQFPAEEAMNMLNQIPENVRNPSAFITKMCHRAQNPAPDASANDLDRIETAIVEFGLDESSSRTLRSLPKEQSLYIIEQVDGSIRNASAFIMSLAHRAEKGKGKGKDRDRDHGPSAEDRIDQHAQKLALDAGAARILRELSPERALDILEQIGDDVRNPSAYVTAEVSKIVPKGSGKGRGRQDRGDSGGRSEAATTKNVMGQIENLAKQLELDSHCVDALHEISAKDAVNILETLARDIGVIRNRSAFVFAEVKKKKGDGRGGGKSRSGGGGGGGGTSRERCKFFAQGKCKNGNECRFSHE